MADDRALTPNERLARVREKAGYSSASEAARAFGWNENTYRSHENGERGIRIDIASKYAKVFKTTPNYILFGVDYDSKYIIEAMVGNELRRMAGWVDDFGNYVEYPVHGYKGSKDKIYHLQFKTTDDFWAAEIVSKQPVFGCYPGDLLLVSVGDVKAKDFGGRLAFVEAADGRQVLRRIRLGQDANLVDLALHAELGAEYIEAVRVNLVIAIIQNGFWKNIPEEEREKLLSEMGGSKPAEWYREIDREHARRRR